MNKTEKIVKGIVVAVILGASIWLSAISFPSPIPSPLPQERSGPDYLYPPVTIPGEINQDVIQGTIGTTICKSGWTATIRPPVSYTNVLKIAQIKEFNYSDTNTKDYEEDHFISLELGGSPTSTKNLWPEAYTTPLGIGARQKDKVETYLKNLVCNGTISLSEAQTIIVNDWYKEYQSLP